MKSYTNIEQSKKLVEILQLDSADGYWFKGFPAQPYMVYTKGTPNPGEHIPAWSLAALLAVLNFPSLTQNKEDEWEVCVIDINNDEYIEMTASNPIDACYEMIIKLHKLNLLEL